MTRPETFDDIPSYLKMPHEVLSWEPAHLTGHPEIEQHIVAARIAAKQAGFAEAEPGHNKVVRHRTEEELQELLERQQDEWDLGKEMYEAALESGMAPQNLYRAASYARREDLTPLSDLVEAGDLRPFEKS